MNCSGSGFNTIINDQQMLSLYLLVSSDDTFCKQFGPRSGLIWIQTVLHFDGIPERIFRKGSIRKKSADDKKCAKLQMYHNL